MSLRATQIFKTIMQELKLVNKKIKQTMAIPKIGKGNPQLCQIKTRTKNVNRAVMKQQSMILQDHLRIFLIWLFKTKQHLISIIKMITEVLTKITDLSALYAHFVRYFKHNIDVCLKLWVALSMMVKIHVVEHFVLLVVPVGDVKVNHGDAK